MLVISCSNDNHLLDSPNTSTTEKVLSIETDSIIELNQSDFPKAGNFETRSLIDSEIRNELTQLNGMYFSIQSVNYGFGNNTLEYVDKGKELKLSPYSSSNNKQKFYFEFPSSASGVLSRIYSAQNKVPIGLGTYKNKPNEYVLFAKSSNTGSFFGYSWDLHYNQSKDAYIIENTDVFSPGSTWATSFFAITSQNGKLSITRIDKGLSQQFTIIPDDDFEIISIDLLHNEAKILETAPYILDENTINNPDNLTITHNYSYSQILTDNTSFQEQNSITTTISGSHKTDIALTKIVSIGGSTSFTSTQQQTVTYGKSSSITTQISKSYNFTVPPKHRLKYQYLSTRSSLDVPYIATLKGRKTIKIRGTWKGVTYYNTYFDTQLYNLENPAQLKSEKRINFY